LPSFLLCDILNLMTKQLTDQELIVKYLKGDDASFEVLVQRYLNSIYRFVYGYVRDANIAEDVTQDVFLKVWRNAKKIDKNKSFKSWVYTIAKNTALDFLKKKKSVPFSVFETNDGKNMLAESVKDHAPLPDEMSRLLEHQTVFLQAIDQLSEKYKQILRMYYYEYLNFREIAEKLKEPINTIKSRHRRGLVLLKQRVLQ